MRKLEIQNSGLGPEYPVWIGEELLANCVTDFVAGELQAGRANAKVAVISNPTVFSLYGEQISASLKGAGIDASHWLMPDGEEHKNLSQLGSALEYLSAQSLSRTDTVISLGGGVVGDLAGLAASLYMRGMGFLQIPTTLLSMVDSSVGGKTAVNLPAGKNLVGTFHHPRAVFADIGVLQTLDVREVRAAFYELIKHGAIGDHELLGQTREFLTNYPPAGFPEYFPQVEFRNSLIDLIYSQIRQKARVIANDLTEDPMRDDAASRKILNFGHTIGHALEKATDYRYFRHGEAVGWGMLTVLDIAKKLEICDEDSINLLNDVVARVGGLPDASNIDIDLVCSALKLDKKRSSEAQQWVLIKRIGNPCIVNGDKIPDSVVRESLSSVLLA